MRKRMIMFLVAYIGIILCVGCQNLPYNDVTPAAYDDTRWVSEEPNIWFENPEDRTDQYLYGKAMTLDGEIDIAVDFGWFDPTIYIYILEQEEISSGDTETESGNKLGDCIMTGICEYSEEYCAVRLEEDEWFDLVGEIIIFKSEPLEVGKSE